MELTWAILLVAFAVAEILSTQLISIWFAFGALAALISSHYFDISIMGQIAVFIIVTAIMLAVSFPLIKKRMKVKYTATNIDLDIGQNATVTEEVDLKKGTGRALLKDVHWSAVPENPNEIIPVGSIVIVKDIQGSKLVVALKNKIPVTQN